MVKEWNNICLLLLQLYTCSLNLTVFNVDLESDDTRAPPPYSSVINEIIHEGRISLCILSTLSHMIAMFTSAESGAPQTEAFTEFEEPSKVAINKFVK